MTIERIKEIQSKTAYPDSVSVQQALLQVWNECTTSSQTEISDEEIEEKAKDYADSIGNKDGTAIFDYIRGYKDALK